MSVAIALDIECRKSTKNRNGLVEIMKKMYSKFGKTHKPYTYKDIINVSSKVAGNDLSEFFADYVAGIKVIPLKKYFGYEGLEIIQQGEIPPVHHTFLIRTPQKTKKDLLSAVLYK